LSASPHFAESPVRCGSVWMPRVGIATERTCVQHQKLECRGTRRSNDFAAQRIS
jgi:hypothetical protein